MNTSIKSQNSIRTKTENWSILLGALMRGAEGSHTWNANFEPKLIDVPAISEIKDFTDVDFTVTSTVTSDK